MFTKLNLSKALHMLSRRLVGHHQGRQTSALQDFEWRLVPDAPEIDKKRQKYLASRRAIEPNIERGIYPFKGIKLSRDDLEWLLATHESRGIRGPVDWNDESQRERKGLDLRGADLQGTILWNLPLARLQGGYVRQRWHETTEEEFNLANMAAVLMNGANLMETQLQGANLQGANLFKAQLQEAVLTEANLSGANLSGANLFNIHLQKASLYKAHLEKASLHQANLEDATLTEANLEKAILAQANLERADLSGAQLQGANLSGAWLEEADLSEAQLKNADLRKACLKGANLSGAQLEGAKLADVSLTDENGVSPQLVDVQWGNTNLAVVDWPRVKKLGDEYLAEQDKESNGKIRKSKDTRLKEYKTAIRADRQLAVVLRDQGLNEEADRFAYRAQVLGWQELQRRALQQLELIRFFFQLQGTKKLSLLERLNIARIFVYLLSWPSLLLLMVEQISKIFPPMRGFLLVFQLVLLLYLLLFTPTFLFLILLLSVPIIFIWLLGLILSLATRLSLMFLPKQRQRIRQFQAFLHLPTIEQFISNVFSAVRLALFLSQLSFKTLLDYMRSAFSLLLDLLAGYGYKPGLTVFWYLLTVFWFAWAYYQGWAYYHLERTTHHSLSYVGAIIFSITAFHGRGFFMGGDLGYDNLITILGAVEAIIGLLIELTFIATFTGRFLRR